MRATAHLAHQALLLHLATELAQSLLELLRILDDYLQASITPFSGVFPARCLGPKGRGGPSAWTPLPRITDALPERSPPERPKAGTLGGR